MCEIKHWYLQELNSQQQGQSLLPLDVFFSNYSVLVFFFFLMIFQKELANKIHIIYPSEELEWKILVKLLFIVMIVDCSNKCYGMIVIVIVHVSNYFVMTCNDCRVVLCTAHVSWQHSWSVIISTIPLVSDGREIRDRYCTDSARTPYWTCMLQTNQKFHHKFSVFECMKIAQNYAQVSLPLSHTIQ